MNIHEYQAKAVLRDFGVPVPRGHAAFSVEEAAKAANDLGTPVVVVKAQIHAGGRGKAGGVKVVKSVEDVRREAARLIGSTLVTHQTGPHGKQVNRLYIEEGSAIDREFYLSALVDRDPSGVRKMIARLSELLRTTTDSRAADEVPLRQELQLLDRYIEIMEIRFQGRLRIERTIEPSTLDALVPNLILQPIVENALEHGASRVLGEGVVQIAARREGDRLAISVHDNGPGVGVRREGVGLGNTRARLAQLYGDKATVTLANAPDGGAVAEVVLPFHV
jgi:glucose-6-phosphate-specific signal transduction histidine kinase